MNGSCWSTRPAVFEPAGGSGVANVESRCARLGRCFRKIHDFEDHTAIESLTSCGRLEPCTAAAADDTNRVDTQFKRGARSEAHARLETVRNAIVYAGYFINEKNAIRKISLRHLESSAQHAAWV